MYEKNGEQRSWARDQMTEANLGQSVTTAVERLLEVWWTQNHGDHTREVTLESFAKLARGHALVSEAEADEVWAPAKPGAIVIRDQVRVRHDAYTGEAGRHHNGRRGRVVGIRHGDVIVKYEDGKQPPFEGVHHSPHALEKRFR